MTSSDKIFDVHKIEYFKECRGGKMSTVLTRSDSILPYSIDHSVRVRRIGKLGHGGLREDTDWPHKKSKGEKEVGNVTEVGTEVIRPGT